MSIFVKLEQKLVTNDLVRRFAPFKQKDCKLPACYVHLFNFSICSKSLADYLRCCQSTQKNDDAQQVNEYLFFPCGDGVLITEDSPLWVWVHDNWQTIDVILDNSMRHSLELPTLIMRAYQYVALHAGAILMHAAAVAYDGQGILFCGVPGAGKSTQARLWERVFDAEAINNDQPCILYEDGRAFVSGTPWSGKEPCYKNLCVPVRAIVFVEQCPKDRVEPMSRAEAYSLLYLNEYVIPIQPETEPAYDAAIEKLVTTIPVVRQYCTMSDTAPKTLHDFLNADTP